MQVKVYVIDIKIPRRVRMLAATLAPLALVFVLRGDVDATPTHFSSGATLTASALQSLNIATRGTAQISVGATAYCGSTAPTTGALGGYTGAKTRCEATCSSPTAHMCSSDEVVRSVQLGYAMPYGFFSLGVTINTGSGTVNDCNGWTSGTSGFYGPAWAPSNTPNIADCGGAAAAVLCCD